MGRCSAAAIETDWATPIVFFFCHWGLRPSRLHALRLLTALPPIVLFRSSNVLPVFIEESFIVVVLAVLGAFWARPWFGVLDELTELVPVFLRTFRGLWRFGASAGTFTASLAFSTARLCAVRFGLGFSLRLRLKGGNRLLGHLIAVLINVIKGECSPQLHDPVSRN